MIVTAIFLLASVVLYFIQKTKNDNDNIKSMAGKLSPKLNQKQSKTDTDHRMEFCDDSLLAVSGKTIETGLPLSFKKVM